MPTGDPHQAGSWVENPKTGELGRLMVAPQETGGVRLVADLYAYPGAQVLGEHVHERLDERFSVLSGTLDVKRDGVESTAEAGEAVEVPAGTAHDWWNAGETTSHVRVEVETIPGSEPMATRFLEMIEVAWSLGALGHTDRGGKPHLLWLAPFAAEYRDVLYLSKPPLAVPRLLFAPLAALGRATGHDPTDRGLHGKGCPAEVPVPAGYEEADERWVPPLR
jgi:mannose-6-phosphate isomerase-like protein (cupin superfamily)